jgi:hypothetical protein
MTAYAPLTSSGFVTGSPVSFEDLRAIIDNPTAIAEGASGAPRVVVPTALSTASTDTSKVLSPDGSGGLALVNVTSFTHITNASGTVVIRLGTGKLAKFEIVASGGGSSNTYHGGSGASAKFNASHPAGGSIEVTIGAGGLYGAGGGGNATDSTVIVKDSIGTEVARLTAGGGVGGGTGSTSSVAMTGTTSYFDSPTTTNGYSGTTIANGTGLATYANGQYVYGIGGRASTAPGTGITGLCTVLT